MDVLVATAIPEEYKAVKIACEREGCIWKEERSQESFSYSITRIEIDDEASFSLGLVLLPEAGCDHTNSVVGTLIPQLKPKMIAMCGICAGDPAQTKLGDIIVADSVYRYDVGELNGDSSKHLSSPFATELRGHTKGQEISPQLLQLLKLWKMEKVDDISETYPIPSAALLEYFLACTSNSIVPDLEPEDLRLVTELLEEQNLLTKAGKVKQSVLTKHSGKKPQKPSPLPVDIKIGSIATGNFLMLNPNAFKWLTDTKERKTLALEMEASAIGRLSSIINEDFLVVKAVTDQAGPGKRKDKRFRMPGAIAAARCLIEILKKKTADLTKTRKPTLQL